MNLGLDSLITSSGWIVATLLAIVWYLRSFSQINSRGSVTSDSDSTKGKLSQAQHAFYKFKAQHFETTLDACPDAVFITNDQGIITYVNPISEGLFGFTPEEMLGNNVTILMPDHIARFHHQYLLDFHLTGKTGTIGRRREIICKHKDGSTFPAELSLGASKEANKYIFIGIITDISERKEAESKHKKAEQLRDILTNSAEGIMVLFTPEGICKLANTAAIKSIDKPESEIIGKHLTDILREDVAKQRLRCLELARESKESFTTHDERNGKTFENTYTPILDDNGNVQEIAIHAVNITERLRYEASLKQAKKTAEEANDSKTLFISKVSHELKNPLNSILGFAHIIQDELNSNETLKNSAPDIEEHKEAIDTIISSGSHILNLINDLLDISSAELDSLPVELTEVKASDLVHDVVKMMQPIAKSANVSLSIQHEAEHDTIIADHQRLKQVITNLVSNAIKYNQQEGQVIIHCYPSADPKKLTISINDNGIGIPKEDQVNLFKVFNRASNGRKISGNGLGLHLCKQLIEHMKGSIHFHSQENQGSQFWVELPLNRPKREQNIPTPIFSRQKPSIPSAEISEKSQPAQSSAFKLLIVEDNPSNLKLIRKITSRIDGIELFQAETCAAGEKMLEKLSPDALILDLNLPDGEGHLLLNKARSVNHIVVLSAFLEESNVNFYDHNIELVLNKPVNVRQLSDQLRNWQKEKHQTEIPYRSLSIENQRS